MHMHKYITVNGRNVRRRQAAAGESSCRSNGKARPPIGPSIHQSCVIGIAQFSDTFECKQPLAPNI